MLVIVQAACQPLQPANSASDSLPTSRAPVALANDTLRVALLLPLTGRQAALGQAVRDGFVAAHLEDGNARRLEFVILDEVADGAGTAWQRALAGGAEAIVGPLLKESLQALAFQPTDGASADAPPPGTRIPTLALNVVPELDTTGLGIWQFGLTPEDEAREVAARAVALGQRRAVVLVPDSDWGQRLLTAFELEFTALGGELRSVRRYAPAARDFSLAIRSLLETNDSPQPQSAADFDPEGDNPAPGPTNAPRRRQDIDLVFLASNSQNASQVMPQLKFYGAADLPVYATSAVWEDGAGDASDLDGVTFPDSPWVLAPDAVSSIVKTGIARHWGRSALGVSRLYALGFDAYRILPQLVAQGEPGPFRTGDFTGVTGTLYADVAGRIHRRLTFVEVRSGRLVPLPPVN
jgi:hypothetical protein